jgi:hypothetical protein
MAIELSQLECQGTAIKTTKDKVNEISDSPIISDAATNLIAPESLQKMENTLTLNNKQSAPTKNKSEKELSEKIKSTLIYSEKTDLRSIPADFASKSPILILKVLEGPIRNEKAITINATGMLGGKRSDGCTYFGQSDNVSHSIG